MFPVACIPKTRRAQVPPIFVFNVVSTQTIAGQFSTASGKTITVYWGDGTSNTYSGTNQAYSKDYGSVGSRTVQIVGDVEALTKYTMTTAGANVQFALADLPSGLTYLEVGGSNTISGSLADLPSSLINFICQGSNTISGSLADLPSGVTELYVHGSNTISGSLADLPSGVTFINVQGSNTISGSIADLPSGVTYLLLIGSNTVSGSLGDLPTGVYYFYCTGSNTIDGYSTRTWANNQQRVYHIPVGAGGLSSAEVDQLLIDLAAAGGTWSGSKQVYLKGTNAARTSTSDSAVSTLTGKGVTVTTT